MVHFEYPKGYPVNHEKREQELKEKYKDVLERFPDSETIFTWNGEKWLIGSSISISYFLPSLGNDSVL